MGRPEMRDAPTTTASASAEFDSGRVDEFHDRYRGAGGDDRVAVEDMADVRGVDALRRP